MRQARKPNRQTWGMRITAGLMAAAMSLSLAAPPLSFATEVPEEEIPYEVVFDTLGETTEPNAEETLPESEDTVAPEGDTTVPEEGTTVPEEGTTVPEEGTTVPEADTSTPEEEDTGSNDIPMIGDTTHWSDPYTDQMVQYGYMRPEDAAQPDAEMSRAEFAAVINRAYNYTETSGTMAFEDVTPHDWFYDDIDIATSAGFITGTSPTTVEPNSPLTRETTAFILGKNLMLPTVFGEDLNFTDTRDISSWSRALVKATSEYGLMAGYTDGSFRPLNNITRGEISALVMKAVGTPILEGGEISLGEIYGNVTITESGTILKNTVIAGDLHISNGIGLGSVFLENVTVLGRIVISGGESEGGDASILLRNVVAEELVIDNMDDQFVSVRVDGNSYIEETFVRTNAYVEDTTTTTNGLINITMDAEPGITLDLAGRVKNVTNTSPGTVIRVVEGTVDVLNIDETATEVVTEVLSGAEIIQLNIDVATNVTGDGDVKNVVVNADDVVIEMLPDNIEIRPGVNANIDGVDMDNLTAEEYSDQPKILSGYPTAYDIAPTGLDAIFATNKTGTVYWAVSNITQGSVTEADLINPPSYGNIALQYGAIDITEAEEEFAAAITELPIGGNYYLAAVLVDTRGDHSPVKVISFSTPDDSVPAFAEGYPYMSEVGNTSGQVSVMATKDCKLYYAVMPTGAIAPTTTDFLAGSVSGNFGFGTQTLTKNKSESYTVSDILDELTDYVLYLWLTDADGMNYSEVTSLTFTTTDGTPPIFNQDVQTTTIGTTDVSFTFNVNEDATLYWAVVDTGTYYPSVKPGDTTGNLSEPLTSEYAAYSVMWGIGALFAGSVDAAGNTTTEFKLTGLGLESSYDLYYVARDLAGNFSTPVQVLTFNTIDNTPPSFVEQQFTHVANSSTDDPDYVPQPYASTSVSIVFSEGIQATNSGQSFMQLYSNVLTSSGDDLVAARNLLASTLEYCFPFYIWSGNSPTAATVRDGDNEDNIGNDWLIDYRNVTVTMLDGQMYINFVSIADDVNKTSALNLSAGVTYGFKIQNIRDSSSDANIMVPAELTAGQNNLGFDQFTTVYAQILLGNADIMVGNLPYQRDEEGNPYGNSYAVVDADLKVTPSDMGNVDEKVVFELRMEPDAWVSYDLYMRIVDPKGVHNDDMLQYYPDTPNLDYFSGSDAADRKIKVANNFEPDDNGWIYLSMNDVNKTHTTTSEIQGTSGSNMGVGLINSFWGYQEDTMPYPFLFELSDDYQYEFVYEVTKFDSTTSRGEWNGFLNIEVAIWAGSYNNAKSIGAHSDMTTAMKNAMSLVSSPEGYSTEIIFTDSIPPEFNTGAPMIVAQDINAELKLALTRQGEVNYVIVKSDYPNNLGPKDLNGNTIVDYDGERIPYINDFYFDVQNSDNWPDPDWPELLAPTGSDLLKQVTDPGDGVISGVVNTGINTISVSLDELEPLTNYYIYFLTKSDSGGGYSDVMVGQFTTLETERPVYKNIKPTPNADVSYATHVDSELTYLFLTYTALQNSPPLSYLLTDMDEVMAASGTATELANWNASNYAGTNMTILDCMSRMFDATLNATTANGWSSDYTVFDVYTPSAVKNAVYDLIEAGVSNHSGQELNLAAEKDVNTLYERTDANANPDMEYVYLVAGRNVNAPTSGTEGDAASTRSFRALTGMRVSDTEFPRITNITTTISTMDSSYYDGTRYSGTIAITFDKTVYALKTSTSTVYPINVREEDNYENALYLEDIVSTIPAPSGANNRITLSKGQSSNLVYVFEFENFQKGEYIYLFNGYNISNADGVARTTSDGGNPLQVTFNVSTETITETSSTIKYSKDLFWTTNWQVDGYGSNSVEISKTEKITSTVPTELEITAENDIVTTKIGGEIHLTMTPLDGIIETPGNISWTFASGSTLGTLNGSEDKATFKALSSGEVVIRVTYSGVTTTITLNVEAPTVTLSAPTEVPAGSFNTISVTIGNVESTANTSGTWGITGGGALYESQSVDTPLTSVIRSFGSTGSLMEVDISFKAATSGGGTISFTYGGVKATENYNFTQTTTENTDP